MWRYLCGEANGLNNRDSRARSLATYSDSCCCCCCLHMANVTLACSDNNTRETRKTIQDNKDVVGLAAWKSKLEWRRRRRPRQQQCPRASLFRFTVGVAHVPGDPKSGLGAFKLVEGRRRSRYASLAFILSAVYWRARKRMVSTAAAVAAAVEPREGRPVWRRSRHNHDHRHHWSRNRRHHHRHRHHHHCRRHRHYLACEVRKATAQ